MPADKDPDYIVVNTASKSVIATRVRVAATSSSRRKGLLGADTLNEASGLWIAPCEAIHTFGMRIPIDAIFLDRECRIRKLVTALPPYRISLCLRADSVLELAAGTILRTGTKVGDYLTFEAAPLH